ncbi:MAG: phosphatase PAP2 family protein [Gemmatimonadaceae bacterium]
MAPTPNRPLLQRLHAKPGIKIWLVPTVILVLFMLTAFASKTGIESLLDSKTISQCDTMVREWFRAHSSAALDQFVVAFALLGSPVAMVVLALTGLSLLIPRRHWSLIFTWDVVFLGLLVLTSVLKRIYHRTRPPGAQEFLYSQSFSFPSGHATSAIVAFGMVGYVLGTQVYKERDQRVVLWIVTPLLILAMGIGRLYLGVHYLSEVVAGFLVGGAWLLVCLWSLKRFGQPAHPLK